jgi:hypothetical protein
MDSDVFAGVFAFQNNLGRTAAAASAASAALAAAFNVTAATFTAAAVFTLTVMAALVAFAVVMMVTVCARRDEFAAQIGLDRLVGVTFRACDNSDPCICQGIQGTSAQAAADQDFNGFVRKEPRQSAVADPVGSDDLAGDDPAFLYIIDLELLCSAKVLENVTVFVGCCNSHVNKLTFLFKLFSDSIWII